MKKGRQEEGTEGGIRRRKREIGGKITFSVFESFGQKVSFP